MHDTVRFILAGKVQEVKNCDPTLMVLDYLRENKSLTGTKEGCSEGDCGACTVVLGELHENGIRYSAVNACIQFLTTLDGKLLLTVEDLSENKSELHPVQQAMVDQHGSQCGFCTPGIVMSLFAMFHESPDSTPSRQEINRELAGNLCRCTGYAPIVRAAEQALNTNRHDHFFENEKVLISALQAIQPDNSLTIRHGERFFYAPRSLDELGELLQKHPDATMVAGATDVGLWVSKHLKTLDTVIYLGAVTQLQYMAQDQEHLRIGAAVTYTDACQAIIAHYPGFRTLIDRIGARQVRNAGTIGGNIANGSPIGDMPPGLIAIGAKLILNSAAGQRTIDLDDFFISYGQQDLREGECVEQILLPLPLEGSLFATYKITKRIEQDISAVCAAFSMQIDAGRIKTARVCFGGMAETPKRAHSCEQALNGKPWSQQTIEEAMLSLLEDFSPITDMRASAAYRMRVAQNLLQRFYLENSQKTYPIRLGDSQVEQDAANA